MTRFEEKGVQLLEQMVKHMNTKKELNIDKVEIQFEKSCDKCYINKSCKQCPIKGKFIEILNMEV